MGMRSDSGSTALGVALRIIDDAWEETRRGYFVQRQLGLGPLRLPDLSLAEAQRRSAVGKSLLRRRNVVNESLLPHDIALTLRLVGFRAETWAKEAEWYWTVVDPMGIGTFGIFLPTAYCGGWLLNFVHGQFRSFQFTVDGDSDRYLGLVADYVRLIDQFSDRTVGQAERGIRMPKCQVRQARELLRNLRRDLRSTVGVAPQRWPNLQLAGLVREVDGRIVDRLEPAYDRLLANLSDAYLEEAPFSVGLGQYPGGDQVYAELAKLHTTLDRTPQEIHAYGEARITEIQRQMQDIRLQLGFDGDDAAFLARLREDARWRADTADEVEAAFERYIARLKPHLAGYFSYEPGATFGVAPLPAALQGSMTYGFYDPPRGGSREGRYLFNTKNLTARALTGIGSLTYHELIPGHHLQLAAQQENELLHPIRKYSLVTAYVEGWAEYAATLAGEIGCYSDPEERYGRLALEAFLTCRLVVDTGMNALGWSLDRAQAYMRQHTAMSDAEIITDLIRYSCDIPAQALAYTLGERKIFELREHMRSALGVHFDIKAFHSTILDIGAVPLADLEWHVADTIDRWRGSTP